METIFNKVESSDLRPMREIVLYELRSAIFENKLNPGDRLVENIIASSMGVSRTPVREALRQLEIEGLAINMPRKGTLVKGISIEDAIEIYDLREVLEGLAVRLACLNISRIEIRKLKEILSIMEGNTSDMEYIEYAKAHSEFNSIVLHASKNKRLIEQLEHIYEYLKSLRKISLNNIERRELALAEHIKIADAISEGDEVLAEKEARAHIVNAKKSFLESYNL
ncbi:GntR family transcriptional regulator [Romboutsia sedimentorum]|uniref:GntR family transcriptional regulator n=1 Tax=Romboutsia sedimentorum TaxID=1368474 RepID=A0ABT7E543_9FIRM|nr:GntR family transcriptional regulator [Romboutsia sedimentorum]MDK2562031.1 GntR family transcriptional regulator [Romboutsia sedimentorum]MDK2584270.1 GntR family transcriptional regulator [Romboutsia sedimentorum]